MNLAPIVLFVYNRPRHTKQTIEALQKNELANDSELFIFSDGAKNEMAVNSVQEVRDYIRSITGFKNIEIIERDKNFGLANSIISGVTEIINKCGKVIVLEDDLISSSKFLIFMNQALNWYANEKRIFSVSGFNFPIPVPPSYKYDGFCSYRNMSWSWGTWKNRWDKADWDVSDFDIFIKDKKSKKLFNRGGDDLSDMLISQVRGDIDSWAIIWAYTHYKYNGFCLYPVKSKIFNIGFDGTGVHSGNRKVNQQNFKTGDINQFHFFRGVLVEDYFINAIRKINKYTYKKKIKNMFKKLMRK